MIKMFVSALEKKEMPPAKRQLQPTNQERAEMVAALNTLLLKLLKEMQWQTMQWLKLGEPINTDCPIKPGRPIDPSLLALNEDGETVGFCCQSCLNQFKRNMADMKNKPNSIIHFFSFHCQLCSRQKFCSCIRSLSSPAPNGHLIREFGGSDRDQIRNSHKQASVTQVLNLLNGYVEQRILGKKDAIVLNNVKNAGSMDSQIETAFLSILIESPHPKRKVPVKNSSKIW